MKRSLIAVFITVIALSLSSCANTKSARMEIPREFPKLEEVSEDLIPTLPEVNNIIEEWEENRMDREGHPSILLDFKQMPGRVYVLAKDDGRCSDYLVLNAEEPSWRNVGGSLAQINRVEWNGKKFVVTLNFMPSGKIHYWVGFKSRTANCVCEYEINFINLEGCRKCTVSGPYYGKRELVSLY